MAGPRPTSIPNGILIHPTVWPQYTNVTDRQDKPVGFYGPITPPVPNAPKLQSLHAAAPPVQSEYSAEHRAAAAVPLPESPWGQTSKSISSVSFDQIDSKFLYNTQETQTQKNDGPEF